MVRRTRLPRRTPTSRFHSNFGETHMRDGNATMTCALCDAGNERVLKWVFTPSQNAGRYAWIHIVSTYRFEDCTAAECVTIQSNKCDNRAGRRLDVGWTSGQNPGRRPTCAACPGSCATRGFDQNRTSPSDGNDRRPGFEADVQPDVQPTSRANPLISKRRPRRPAFDIYHCQESENLEREELL